MSQVSPFTNGANAPAAVPPGHGLSLLLISVLGLFLELLFIRWGAGESLLFNFLQNTILVVCFLGLGMGCWTCRQPIDLRSIVSPLFLLVFVIAVPIVWLGEGGVCTLLSIASNPHSLLESIQTRPLYTFQFVVLDAGIAFLVLYLLWLVFLPIGRLLGRLMDDHPRIITAYSINVVGSLIGIWMFVLLSVLSQPPLVWFVAVAVLLALLARGTIPYRPSDWAFVGAIVLLAGLASWSPGALELDWSPYSKLSLFRQQPSGEPANKEDSDEGGEYLIRVNNNSYQVMINLSAAHVAAHPEIFPPEQNGLGQYDLPLLLHPKPLKMLVVGAGSGNDVAGGLRHGCAHIVAVEIDPAIISIGRRFHPEHPYNDARVSVVNDDARSYFANSHERFDVIAFGLLDSPLSTGAGNARLDHFVYTKESLEQAKSLLAEGGILVLTFEILHPFMPERMFVTLREVFGHDPLYFRIPRNAYGWGGVMFVASDNQEAVQQQIAQNQRLARHIDQWQKAYVIPWTGLIPIPTDDWPYIYLESPTLPLLHVLAAATMAVLFFVGLRQVRSLGMLHGWERSHWHFFFLGAAFMLLETQNITKAAVVLGSTWWVNAIIISCILGLILLANWIAVRLPNLSLAVIYGLLFVSCVSLYFFDLAWLATLPYGAKALLVGTVVCLPMLFSGIIFIRSFAAIPRKDTALGANLIGSLIGGMLQWITFLTGIKFLLLLVLAFYLAAWLSRPRTRQEMLKEKDTVPMAEPAAT
jgi:spermidine synthase